jgi:isopenicillin N synthase-like dioxygenase
MPEPATADDMIEDIPTIDFARLHEAATLAELDRACREWGFFHLVGDAIDAPTRAHTLAAMRAFFALPAASKHAIERTADNPWGFYDRELTKNVRDWKQILDVGPDVPTAGLDAARAQWPADMPSLQPALHAFTRECERVAQRLLEAICVNLGMPAHHLDACFGSAQTSFLRLNWYPTCPDPAPADSPTTPAHGQLGIHHHTDSGALTVLLQDAQPGLQVLHGERWHTVQPRPGALVINIGDVVQVWSNDRYRAPLHRVLANASAERYSAPFFFNPSFETVYAPLPGACDAANPPRYRPISWAEFRAARAAGDYADVGEEVQISHFLI